jgi:hypothetical protein
MYLLYLDWNAMKALRDAPEGNAAFREAFEPYRDRFWMPYSSTHLDDLARRFDPTDERKVEFTRRDLLFIGQLTGGLSFQVYHGHDKPFPDRRDPLEFFESHYEQQQEGLQNAFSLFTSSEDSSAGLMERLLNMVLDLPVVPFPEQARGTVVAEMFPGWSKQGTLRSVIRDMDATTQRASTDHTYSKELRSVIRNGLPMLDTRVVSSPNVTNPFERIEELLAPHMGGRAFFDITDSMLINPSAPNNPPTALQRFINSYYLLDLLGYHADDLKPKNHFPNIISDATHAFLAGHCDFLVTNDKDLRYKAKAVYKKQPTSTEVLSIAEFTALLQQGLAEYTPTTCVPYIQAALRDGILAPASQGEELPPTYVLPYDLFDHFNAFERPSDDLIKFIHIETTYRNFIPRGVVRQVVEFLTVSLGTDDNGKAAFDPAVEMDEITADLWPGRHWRFPECNMSLVAQEGNLQFTLKFADEKEVRNSV